MSDKKFSLRDRLKSFSHAFRGINSSLLSEHNMWIHMIAAVVVIFLGLFFNVTTTEWLILLLCIGVVLAAELFNTAIEELANAITKEQNEKIGRAKDVAAGAVLVVAITAAVVGILVLLPYFMK
ncbi:MAG: diacylglycerol kinase family protein [Flavobacteriales bacterium]|nr:diacylglycerol kinase family protein [Flavobacteriales bacterium]